MKNPLKKEYLNQYKESAGGGYEFTGAYYSFSSGEFTKRVVLIILMLSLLGALIVASGCLNAGGMKNSFYVILPYIGEVSAFFALAWNCLRLLFAGQRVKEYIFKAAYPRLPRISVALSIIAAVSLICSVVFIILNGAEGGALKCALYIGFKVLIGVLAFVFRLIILKTEYTLE